MTVKLIALNEDAMIWKFPAASKLALWLAAGAVVATGFAATASAQSPRSYDERGRPYYSWLDAGTEVLPGDRKFTDYAFPQARSFGMWNNNRPLDRQPLNPASDLGGWYPQTFPLY
jgi:hypothetical protein